MVGSVVLGEQCRIVDFGDGSARGPLLVRRMEEGNAVRRVQAALAVLRHEFPVEGTSVELLG